MHKSVVTFKRMSAASSKVDETPLENIIYIIIIVVAIAIAVAAVVFKRKRQHNTEQANTTL